MGHFQKQPAAAIAEDAAPDLFETDRDDRRRTLLEDLLEAAVEGQQEAGAREPPLGEDADQLPLGEMVARLAQRLDDRRGPPDLSIGMTPAHLSTCLSPHTCVQPAKMTKWMWRFWAAKRNRKSR